MPLYYKDWTQLTPEEEKRQQQEKLASGSYMSWVTSTQPDTSWSIYKDVTQVAMPDGTTRESVLQTTYPTAESMKTPILKEPTTATPSQPIVSTTPKEPTPEPTTVDPRQRYLDIAKKDPSAVTAEDRAYLREIQARMNLWETVDQIFWTSQVQQATWLDKLLSSAEKQDIIDTKIREIRSAWYDYETTRNMINKIYDQARDWSLFGGETQKQILQDQYGQQVWKLEWETAKALQTAEDVFRQDLERETARIKEKWDQAMNTLQRLNSLRWAWRWSYNEKVMREQQDQINWLITTAQQNADLKLQQRKMEIEWASAEAKAALAENLAANEQLLSQRISEATDIQNKLNWEIGLSFRDSLTNMLNVVEAAWIDTSNADFEWTLRSQSPYVLDREWWLWINPLTWFPEMFKYPEWVKPSMSSYKDANGNLLIMNNWMLDTLVTNQWQVISWDGTLLFNLPRTQVEQNLKQQWWAKLNDNTLFNKDTWESRSLKWITDLWQFDSNMTEDEAQLNDFQLPDWSIITASNGLANALDWVLTEYPWLQFDLNNLYRTKDQQMKLYGQGRTAEELASKGVPTEYANPEWNVVTWTLNSSHMTWNAVDLVVPKWENAKEYTWAIEPILNEYWLYRPDSTVAMWDYGHFEYKWKAVDNEYKATDMMMYNNSTFKPQSDLKTKADKAKYEKFVEDKKNIMSDKNADIYDILKYSAWWKDLTDSTVTSLNKFDSVINQLSSIQEQIKKMKTWPAIWKLKSLNPYDVDAQTLKAQLTALIPNLARWVYWEVWVLTDNDVRLYSQTIPNLTSTNEVNDAILAMTLEIVAWWYKRQLQSLAAAGKDVSWYAWLYENLTSQANALKVWLWITDWWEQWPSWQKYVPTWSENIASLAKPWNSSFGWTLTQTNLTTDQDILNFLNK